LTNKQAINSAGLAQSTRQSDCNEGGPSLGDYLWSWSFTFASSDTDDPRKWMFGPSLSSDMIIASARRIMSI
jgi:hypothetical protein